MRKNRFICIMLCVTALLLTACSGTQNKPAAAEQTAAPETAPATLVTTAPAETEVIPEGDAATHYIDTVYAEQIILYQTALKEQWDEGTCYEQGISPLVSYYYEGDAMENVGFALEDLDHDGQLELIIGAILDTDLDPAIFEIWTLKDGKPVQLCQSGYRNRYYVEYSQEDDNWMIANIASNSAFNSASIYYNLENGELKVVQAVVLDAMANEDNPWFLAADDDWDTSNDTPIEEALAMEIIESHNKLYTVPEYIPYSLY